MFLASSKTARASSRARSGSWTDEERSPSGRCIETRRRGRDVRRGPGEMPPASRRLLAPRRRCRPRGTRQREEEGCRWREKAEVAPFFFPGSLTSSSAIRSVSRTNIRSESGARRAFRRRRSRKVRRDSATRPSAARQSAAAQAAIEKPPHASALLEAEGGLSAAASAPHGFGPLPTRRGPDARVARAASASAPVSAKVSPARAARASASFHRPSTTRRSASRRLRSREERLARPPFSERPPRRLKPCLGLREVAAEKTRGSREK